MTTVVNAAGTKWPKYVPPLSAHQRAISDDFMRVWHEYLPRYAAICQFNHKWVVDNGSCPCGMAQCRTLELGAGLGDHIAYEPSNRNYVAVEVRENMAEQIRRRFHRVDVWAIDCQNELPFPDQHFHRIIAIHLLEHLPDLPAAIQEAHRLCHPRGVFQVVIPCEGGLAYSFCRRISAQRIFEKRYRESYKWFIEREHINRPTEIMEELVPYFDVVKRSYFPLRVPVESVNLCIAMNLRPKERN